MLVSDLHLCAKPPVARSGEPDWFAAMARPLREISHLAKTYDVPVFYAGDIFDRWNAGPQVINFALQNLHPGHAVPGQHDLPNHNYGDIEKTAYWTLVEAGILTNLPPGEVQYVADVAITGFPWGYPPAPAAPKPRPGCLRVAIIHRFIYTDAATGYPGADPGLRVGASLAGLRGYDVAAYGDNHKGFIITKHGTTICNCGGLMRRKTDERNYRPGVGLLTDGGDVVRHYLDTTDDIFAEYTEAEEHMGKLLDMSAFTDGLESLGGGDALVFEAAVRRFLDTNKPSRAVRDIVMETLEK